MSTSGKYVLSCKDCFGSLLVFERQNFEKHRSKHPELNHPKFCPDRLIKALQEPTFTIKGLVPHTLCYYYEEFAINGILKYTKVIVHEEFRNRKKSPVCYVKTAFRIDNVKEDNYNFTRNYHH